MKYDTCSSNNLWSFVMLIFFFDVCRHVSWGKRFVSQRGMGWKSLGPRAWIQTWKIEDCNNLIKWFNWKTLSFRVQFICVWRGFSRFGFAILYVPFAQISPVIIDTNLIRNVLLLGIVKPIEVNLTIDSIGSQSHNWFNW